MALTLETNRTGVESGSAAARHAADMKAVGVPFKLNDLNSSNINQLNSQQAIALLNAGNYVRGQSGSRAAQMRQKLALLDAYLPQVQQREQQAAQQAAQQAEQQRQAAAAAEAQRQQQIRDQQAAAQRAQQEAQQRAAAAEAERQRQAAAAKAAQDAAAKAAAQKAAQDAAAEKARQEAAAKAAKDAADKAAADAAKQKAADDAAKAAAAKQAASTQKAASTQVQTPYGTTTVPTNTVPANQLPAMQDFLSSPAPTTRDPLTGTNPNTITQPGTTSTPVQSGTKNLGSGAGNNVNTSSVQNAIKPQTATVANAPSAQATAGNAGLSTSAPSLTGAGTSMPSVNAGNRGTTDVKTTVQSGTSASTSQASSATGTQNQQQATTAQKTSIVLAMPSFQQYMAGLMNEAATAGTVPYQFATLGQAGVDAAAQLMQPRDQAQLKNIYDQYQQLSQQYQSAGNSPVVASQMAAAQVSPITITGATPVTASTVGQANQVQAGNATAALTSASNVDAGQVNQMAEQLYDSNLVKNQKEELRKSVQTQLNNALSSLNVQEMATGNIASSRAGVAEGITRRGSMEALAKGNAEIDNTARTQALTQAQGILQTNQNLGYQANTQNAANQNAVNQFNIQNDLQAQQYNTTTEAQRQQFNANVQNQIAEANRQAEQATQQFNAGQLTTANQFNVTAQNQMTQQNAANQLAAQQFNKQQQLAGLQGSGNALQNAATLAQTLTGMDQQDAQTRLNAALKLQEQQQAQNDVARQNTLMTNQPFLTAAGNYAPYINAMANYGIQQTGSTAATGTTSDLTNVTGQSLQQQNTQQLVQNPGISDAAKIAALSGVYSTLTGNTTANILGQNPTGATSTIAGQVLQGVGGTLWNGLSSAGSAIWNGVTGLFGS